VSLVSVVKDSELQGRSELSEIFAEVAGLLFDDEEPRGSGWIYQHLHP
jgi:hypothetical protein